MDPDATYSGKSSASAKKSMVATVAEEASLIPSAEKDDAGEINATAKPPKRVRKLTIDDPVSRRLIITNYLFRERNAMKMKNLEAQVEELTAAVEAAKSSETADVFTLKTKIAGLLSRNSALEAETTHLRNIVLNKSSMESASALLDESSEFAPSTATPEFISLFNLIETSQFAGNGSTLNTPLSPLSSAFTGNNTTFVGDFLFHDTMLSTLFPSISLGSAAGVHLDGIQHAQE
ncbi:hypothetical protein HDU83_008989 [Entophlyctis luteolus]|nr:hypothetical protein HDU83_008989 [Entophlyctis luteolus]